MMCHLPYEFDREPLSASCMKMRTVAAGQKESDRFSPLLDLPYEYQNEEKWKLNTTFFVYNEGVCNFHNISYLLGFSHFIERRQNDKFPTQI